MDRWTGFSRHFTHQKSGGPRQNSLALALREVGRIERALFMLEWIQDPEVRRRAQVGLNDGEARNALASGVLQPPGRNARP